VVQGFKMWTFEVFRLQRWIEYGDYYK